MNNEKEKLDMRLLLWKIYKDATGKVHKLEDKQIESKTECLVHTISLYKRWRQCLKTQIVGWN